MPPLAGSWRLVVGLVVAREWLVRRAGAWGVSRPRWRQSRSPVALPGHQLARVRRGRRRLGTGHTAECSPVRRSAQAVEVDAHEQDGLRRRREQPL